MKNLFDKYSSAYAFYDIGAYYGVCIEESFYFVDKQSLEIVKSAPRYDSETIDIIEKAVPILYADEEDLD